MLTEKQKMKQFYESSVSYQNLLSNLSNYNRDAALERYAMIVREFAPGPLVIDLGCGTGETTRRLRAKGLHPIGVDISLLLLRTSQSDTRLQPAFVSADISALPFQPASVDCVALHDVIEHIPDVESLLDEIVRVLRPNGRVVIASPNLLSPIKPVRHLLGIEGFNVNFYGSATRAFLAIFGNITTNLRKTLSRKPRFTFRQPILDGFLCPDDDAIFLANYFDLEKWFELHGMIARYHRVEPDKMTIIGRLKSGLARLFPWLDKGFVLVAERSGSAGK